MCKDDKHDEIEAGCGCEENGECNCGDDKDCDCGHDHDHEGHHHTVTLVLDDDQELECPVIEIFEVGEQEYIALFHPVDETALLYRFKDYEDGTIEIDSLESDEEYEKVSKVFLALQEELLEEDE